MSDAIDIALDGGHERVIGTVPQKPEPLSTMSSYERVEWHKVVRSLLRFQTSNHGFAIHAANDVIRASRKSV